ncbi:MAG: aminoglycoside phosphotransferase family protein [Clostridia bacterium]|nr:aminoglycoside phosphotransferase family protein [Clostridia bacterium]
MLFHHICESLHLGTPLSAPVPLHGGYTHRMYSLLTDCGHYAIKLLNPEIMQRTDALENYHQAETFEARLEQASPLCQSHLLPARLINGRKLHCIDGQYVYIFDYFDGKVLPEDCITPLHCEQMGCMLSAIHAIDHRELTGEPDHPEPINWHALADALLADEEAHTDGLALRSAIPMLVRVTAAAESAALQLPRVQTICHNDMDAKNVLWQGRDYRIIDLECLGWGDPVQELLDLAVSWGGWPLEEARFKSFIRGYCSAGAALPGALSLHYDSRRNHIDWLAYNASRALSGDPAERTVGRSQIGETIAKIESDQQNRTLVLQWLSELQP